MPAVVVEGGEDAAELRQQRGEVPAGRRNGGEGEDEEAHDHQPCLRPHFSVAPILVSSPTARIYIPPSRSWANNEDNKYFVDREMQLFAQEFPVVES